MMNNIDRIKEFKDKSIEQVIEIIDDNGLPWNVCLDYRFNRDERHLVQEIVGLCRVIAYLYTDPSYNVTEVKIMNWYTL